MAPNIKDVSYTNGIVEDEKRNLNSISTKRPTTEIVWRNVILFVYLHISAVYGFYLFLFAAKWQTMFFAFLLHLYGGLGITAGAHRLWAHKSYKAKAPLRIFLMLCNCVAFENDVYEWSRDHRVHHKFSETDADPHNATRGFFFSHMGWLLVRKHPDVRDKGGKVDMADLAADKVLMFQRKYYIPLVVSMCFMMPSFGPHYFWGESLPIAFYVCAMFRYTVTLHSTWLVNSAAHMWGQRPYDKHASRPMKTRSPFRVGFQLLATLVVLTAPLAASVPVNGTSIQRNPEAPSNGDWTVLMANGGAPIRTITRRYDGILIGGASTGNGIDVWTSNTGGASWSLHGTVANDPSVEYGDVTMSAISGTHTIFCAFREFSGGQYRVTVCRSDNDGDDWVYDSTVVGPVTPFVGAPFIFQRENGDLQIYYDSELLAQQQGYSGHQWIAMQGRSGTGGSWDVYGVVAVSWDKTPGALNREGMATVVQLGGDRLLVVCEGVEPFPTGGSSANVIHSVESWDGGVTWDDSMRRTVYQSWVDSGSGRRYNAYVPYAIRVGGGPVGAAFCTDEDKAGPPDYSSDPVDQRQCHVKYISTTTDFETWSGTSTVWTQTTNNYTPGLFERSLDDLISAIDTFDGSRVVERP